VRFLLALIIWSSTFLTWTADGKDTLAKMTVEPMPHESWCQIAELHYVMPACVVETTIYYRPAFEMWVLLHESQHVLCTKYGIGDSDWDKFTRVAMKAVRKGNYSRAEIREAKYMATYGGHELHAQLPWIVRGDIPPCLQRWYPWFELEGAKAK